MKTFLILLLGAVLGILGWRYYQRTHPAPISEQAEQLADQTRDAAEEVKDKAEDWKLTPENIREELAKTGRVVRTKARAVGGRLDDARIVAVIKGKYVVEKDLSSLAISVECREGAVRLTGTVPGVEQIGRAVTLALQTDGVKDVVAQLTVRN